MIIKDEKWLAELHDLCVDYGVTVNSTADNPEEPETYFLSRISLTNESSINGKYNAIYVGNVQDAYPETLFRTHIQEQSQMHCLLLTCPNQHLELFKKWLYIKKPEVNGCYYSLSYSIKTDLQLIDASVLWLDQFTKQFCKDCCRFDDFKIKLVYRELLTNAMRHGNEMQTNKNVQVVLSYDINRLQFSIAVWDEGTGFDYNKHLIENERDELRIRQRGLFIISEFSSHIEAQNNYIKVDFQL